MKKIIIEELKARDITNIDITVIVNEINVQLVEKHARLDQFFQLGESKFVFRFKTNEGKKDLVFYPPKFLFIRESEAIEAEINPFVTALKNNFLNRILRSVKQIQDDRIISLEFDNGTVIIECIKKGNILIVSNGKIVNLSKVEISKERKLEINETYIPPTTNKKELTKSRVFEILNISEEKVVVALTRTLVVPAFYVNKILEEIGIDPKIKSNELTKEEREKIAERMEEFYKSVINGRTEIMILDSEYFVSDNKLTQKLKSETKEIEKISSLSEVLNLLYKKETIAEISMEKSKKLKKLENRLAHQNERIKEITQEMETERKKGEWILQNIELVNLLIEEYNKIKKTNDKQKIKEFLEKNNATLVKDGIKIIIETK